MRTLIIHNIPLAMMPDIVNTMLHMSNLNHNFRYNVHSDLDNEVFNLSINSYELKIHLDEYKIIVSDILPNVTVTLQHHQYGEVTIR